MERRPLTSDAGAVDPGQDWPEAFSVRAYRAIRASVPDATARLSEGRNIYPPPEAVVRALARSFEGLLHSPRVTDYESAADAVERRLVAQLVSRYAGWPGLEESHVFFVSGAQEGISLVYGWAARAGLATVLPLPVYYAFEQSALRWGVPIAGYVSATGQFDGAIDRDVLDARIIPNAATGTLFPPPRLQRPAAFTFVDAIYQVGELGSPRWIADALRDTLAQADLERTALVMTASKDLSLPKLRAGVLITRNESLLAYLREDRFERISAANPLTGQVMAYYMGLLTARDAEVRPGGETIDVGAAFREAGLAWLSDADVRDVLVHWQQMAARNEQHLRLLDALDLPLSVQIHPRAGYSLLADLDPPFADAGDYLRWCHYAGKQHSLRLNPSYVLGGTPAAWTALYPGRSLLRVNLSNTTEGLIRALDRLRLALDTAGR